MPSSCIHVCIAHRNALVAHGLRAALDRQAGIALVEAGRAQIVVADPARGLALAGAQATKVLVVAEDEQLLHAALAAGVDGYLDLDGSPHDLLTGIRLLAGGARYLGPSAARRLAACPPPARLTPRQLQVLRAVAGGASNKRVAQALQITPGTVKAHLKAVYGLLGARSRTHALRIALERGLLGDAPC